MTCKRLLEGFADRMVNIADITYSDLGEARIELERLFEDMDECGLDPSKYGLNSTRRSIEQGDAMGARMSLFVAGASII